MEKIQFDDIEALQKKVSEEFGPWSEPIEVTQEMINQFADLTGDHQWIHVDVERAKRESPFGAPVAHGFLTLSLLPFLQSKMQPGDPAAFAGLAMGINYGLNKVRFPSPVKVDSKVRARRELVSAELANPSTIQQTHKVTIEIEGEAKPACVAESLTRLVYS